MFINIAKLFVLFAIVLQCKCELQIIKNELPEDVKILAIGTVERELLLKHSDSVVAQTLSADFSKIYGGKWTTYVGLRGYIEGILFSINAAPNTTLWFAYNTTNVLLFKSNQCETTSYYTDVIEEALNYKVTHQRTDFNESMTNAILSAIKESIAESGSNCSNLVTKNYIMDNCYYIITAKIHTKLHAKFGHIWVVTVGKLNAAAITVTYERAKAAYEVVFSGIIDFTILYFEI